MITKEEVEKFLKHDKNISVGEHDKIREDIEDRITEILKIILEIYSPGYKLDTWYFEDAEEGELGNLIKNINEDYIHSLVVENKTEKYICAECDYENEIWYLTSSFPTKWLYYENDKIKKYINDGITKMEKKKKSQKQKRQEYMAKRKLMDAEVEEFRKSLKKKYGIK